MSGSMFGDMFRISTWGESHGAGIGVVVDGCPAGLEIDESYIQMYLNRRKPGQSRFATPRKEDDAVQILSGVFEGKTTGTPISLVIFNNNQRSHDYSEIANIYRPGHADYTFDAKYGFRDYRGGGRSSGRETAARVAAGAIAIKLLHSLGIEIFAYTRSISDIAIDYNNFNKEYILNNPLYMPDEIAASEAELFLNKIMDECNSVGGVIECVIKNMPAGIGEPVFDKLDANLAKALMSIGSVKGIEIGEGFNVASMTGYDNNDSYEYNSDNAITKQSNNAGGILGGISDGSDIILRAAIKPTPSIYKTQQSVNKSGENIEVNIKGRHDPIIVPRAVVVVESMVAITLVDMLFKSMSSKLDNVIKFFNR